MISRKLDTIVSGGEDRSVGEEVALRLHKLHVSWPDFQRRSSSLVVLAAIGLRDTERVWYVVGVREVDGNFELMGYEPRGRYHAPGDGWFVLTASFFDRAARATGSALEFRIFERPVRLEDIDEAEFSSSAAITS